MARNRSLWSCLSCESDFTKEGEALDHGRRLAHTVIPRSTAAPTTLTKPKKLTKAKAAKVCAGCEQNPLDRKDTSRPARWVLCAACEKGWPKNQTLPAYVQGLRARRGLGESRHPWIQRVLKKWSRAKNPSACPRVPVCILDALREGATLRVDKAGQGFGVFVDGQPKPIAKRKRESAAIDLVDAARAEVQAAQGSCPPAFTTSADERRRQVIVTPQRPEGEAVVYRIEPDAARVAASHNASSFQPRADYPPGIQERAYHLDKAEQFKVIDGAATLRPDLLLARTPSALDGPTLVTDGADPIALGGNGRLMMVQRAYALKLPTAESYRAELERRAPEFGLDSASVASAPAPVLVRVVEGLTRQSARPELLAAVRRFNEGLTQAMDPKTAAVAQARVLGDATVRELGELLAGSDDSLRELMRARPEAFLAALERDGVVNERNRSKWVDGAGALTDEAKDTIEAMFLGLVLGTADRLRATAPALLRKIERAVPHLVAVRGSVPAFDLVPVVQRAVDLLNDARGRGLSLAELQAQGSLFGGSVDEDAPGLAVAGLLDREGQRGVGAAFQRWAAASIHDPRQGMLFGAPPTPEDAFRELVGLRVPNPCACRMPNPHPRLVTCPQCAGAGRVTPWAGKIDVCPLCRGARRIAAPEGEDRRQARLFNPGPGEMVTRSRGTAGLARDLRRQFPTGFPEHVTVKHPGGRLFLWFSPQGGLVSVRRKLQGKNQPKLARAIEQDLAAVRA